MTKTANFAEILSQKIENRTANVAIIGLGYVGLPLAVEFAHAGFNVTGIDLDELKIRAIGEGRSYIKDVKDEAVRAELKRAGCAPQPISRRCVKPILYPYAC